VRIDISITGNPEEREKVTALAGVLANACPEARVVANLVERVVYDDPQPTSAGQRPCKLCGVWYPAGEAHVCLPKSE